MPNGSSKDGRYTLIIPTFNRPQHLRRLLTYFSARDFSYPIIVLDASAPENQAQNAETCRNYGGPIVHKTYSSDTRVFERVAGSLENVTTDYVSLCGDDDILLPDILPACFDILDEHADVAGCHGIYLGFHERDDGLSFTHVEYALPSILSETVFERVVEVMLPYEAMYYAVFRKEVAARVFRQALELDQPMFRELYHTIGSVAAGKIVRLNQEFLCRNGGTGTSTSGLWEPNSWFCEDAAHMFLAYRDYRIYLAKNLMRDLSEARELADIEQFLDVVHTIYFARSLDTQGALRAAARKLGFDEERSEKIVHDYGQRTKPLTAEGDQPLTAAVSDSNQPERQFEFAPAVAALLKDKLNALIAQTYAYGLNDLSNE